MPQANHYRAIYYKNSAPSAFHRMVLQRQVVANGARHALAIGRRAVWRFNATATCGSCVRYAA